jgi:signal transduction histidine kinase
MKIKLLVISQANQRLKLMQSLNKALLQKYHLVFYPWPSKDDLNSMVRSCMVVIISDFAAAAAAAAAAEKTDSEVKKPIVFITSKEKYQENLKKYTSFVTIGHNWKLLVLDDEFLDAVGSAINLSHHSHKVRTTLHSLRKQLRDSKAVPGHVPYYRQLLELEKNVQTKNKELFKINEELKELDKLKSVFLSMTSHELKTPITPIKLQAQNLLSEFPGKLNADQKSCVEMILRNTNQLNNLLSDVLDSAKLEVDRLKMFPEKTELNKIIKEILEDVKPLANKNNVAVESNLSKLPVVLIDQKRFRQVLLNLINNGIKFTSTTGKITITARKTTKDITITITDTGVGIPKNMIDDIFNRFVQATPSYKLKKRGTGLGLSICKGLVTKWGGKIWAESEGKNKGATFHFTIPLKNRNI